MVGIKGNVWNFNEPLTTISWGAPRSVPADKIGEIKRALAEDIYGTGIWKDDPYFGGKQIAVFARLSQ